MEEPKRKITEKIIVDAITLSMEAVLPPHYFVRISYDFTKDGVIQHIDSKYKVDFGPLARTPENTKLEKISESLTGTNDCPQGYRLVDMFFSIKGANLKNLCYEASSNSLIASIEGQSQTGFIHLYIPRILLDAKSMNCEDVEFFVIVNGEEREYDEIKLEKFRTIKVPLQKSDIEVEIGVPLQLESGSPSLEQCQKLIQQNYRLYQQFKWALYDDRIICKDGLQKITKKSDNSSVCVKPESIYQLIERGWAKPYTESNAPGRISIEETGFRDDINYIKVDKKFLIEVGLENGFLNADSYVSTDPITGKIHRGLAHTTVVAMDNHLTKKLESFLIESNDGENDSYNHYYLEYDEKLYWVGIFYCNPQCPGFIEGELVK